MGRRFSRIVTVDWSGAASASGQRRDIWLAELDATRGEVVRVRPGFTREEVTDELLRLASGGRTLIGLDFAFSYPASWARDESGFTSAPELWERYWSDGIPEDWTDRPPWRPDDRRLRRTDEELDLPEGYPRPRSAMDLRQIHGNVGRQTLRGIPTLLRLRGRANVSVWPFDPAEGSVVVEIYPGAYRPSDDSGRRLDRDATVDRLASWMDLPRWLTALMRGEPNAFDAALAGLVLLHHIRSVEMQLAAPRTDLQTIEGEIVMPQLGCGPVDRGRTSEACPERLCHHPWTCP